VSQVNIDFSCHGAVGAYGEIPPGHSGCANPRIVQAANGVCLQTGVGKGALGRVSCQAVPTDVAELKVDSFVAIDDQDVG